MRKERRIKCATSLVLLVVAIGIGALMPGCSIGADDATPAFVPGITSHFTGKRSDTFVLVAKNGERGYLPALLASRPGLASELAEELLPKGVDSGYRHEAAFLVAGAERTQTAIYLYVLEGEDVFRVLGGRLILDNAWWVPVRVRLSETTLRVQGVDEPFDSDYSELRRIMPEWAVRRLGNLSPPTRLSRVLQKTAWRWAVRNDLLAHLVSLPRPDHVDPHHHVQDIYGLRAIPQRENGFSVRVAGAPPWNKSPYEPPEDRFGNFEQESTSPDGRFLLYESLGGPSRIVVHDLELSRWVDIRGPNIDLVLHFSWVGRTLVFDKDDLGLGWDAGLKPATIVHVEVDLEKPAVDRVVPIGPYTGNWPPPTAATGKSK